VQMPYKQWSQPLDLHMGGLWSMGMLWLVLIV